MTSVRRKPLRIVHTFFKYPPAPGGHERHVQDLAEGLLARGYDARVVTSTLRTGPAARRKEGARARLSRALGLGARGPSVEFLGDVAHEVNGVPVVRLDPALPVDHRVVLPKLADTLRTLDPDLIHAHDIWRSSFEVSIDVARERSIPLLLSPVYHERPGAKHLAALRRVAAKVPEDALVFFNTPWEEKRLGEAGVRFARTGLLPPSIDLEEIAGIPERAVPGVPGGSLLITFVGRLVPGKGIDVLIGAFAASLAKLREERDPAAERAHLAIAGYDDGSLDVAALVRASEVADRVTVLADRPRAEIVNLLRQSSIFAFPSRIDTFGIAVLEAWATENLVVVGEHGGLPYLVRDGDNGIVCRDGGWPEALLEAIRALATPRGRELVRRGYETARVEHGRTRRIDELVAQVEAAVRDRTASR